MIFSTDTTALSIEQIITSVIVISSMIFSLSTIIMKIYKGFLKVHNIKNKEDNYKATVVKNTEDIVQLNEKMDIIMEMHNQTMEVNKIQTRHSIVTACNEALEKGFIDRYQLQSIEDMFTIYQDVLNGNSYVCTLVSKVRNLVK